MKCLKSKRLGGKKGFTLIELIVVITILGILMMAVSARIGTYQKEADKAACQGNMRTISSAQAVYFATNDNSFALTASDIVNAGLISDSLRCPGGTGVGPDDYVIGPSGDMYDWVCNTSRAADHNP